MGERYEHEWVRGHAETINYYGWSCTHCGAFKTGAKGTECPTRLRAALDAAEREREALLNIREAMEDGAISLAADRDAALARVEKLEAFLRDWLRRPNPVRDDYDAVAKAFLSGK